MSTDKRSVSTDALETLGTLLGPDEKRDAIHLAVEPVIAGMLLERGQYIRVVNGVAWPAAFGKDATGIVDPFFFHVVKHDSGRDFPRDYVIKDERFWFVMLPRMVHSLRHVWTHPDFPDEGAAPVAREWKPICSKKDAEKWLRDYLDGCDSPGFDTVMKLIRGEAEYDPEGYSSYMNEEYLHFAGSDAHGDIVPEFWDYVSAYLGEEQHVRPAQFSCSC